MVISFLAGMDINFKKSILATKMITYFSVMAPNNMNRVLFVGTIYPRVKPTCEFFTYCKTAHADTSVFLDQFCN